MQPMVWISCALCNVRFSWCTAGIHTLCTVCTVSLGLVCGACSTQRWTDCAPYVQHRGAVWGACYIWCPAEPALPSGCIRISTRASGQGTTCTVHPGLLSLYVRHMVSSLCAGACRSTQSLLGQIMWFHRPHISHLL